MEETGNYVFNSIVVHLILLAAFGLTLAVSNGGFYAGELKSFGIVSDSEPNKDFLLVNVAYKKQESDAYVILETDGVLLNFADTESLSFIKQTIP